MFVGIVITNLSDSFRFEIHPVTIDKFGEVALNLFLAMSLMSMQLWSLATAVGPILVVLMVQMLVITFVVVFVVYRAMGRDYDACIISAGFVGLGLGATPVAIANMDAVTTSASRRYADLWQGRLQSPFVTPSRRITILLFAPTRPLTHPPAHALPVKVRAPRSPDSWRELP